MVVDCEAGHEGHDTITLKTDIGLMEVYNWEMYNDLAGKYCPGQDDVSRTIINTGNWARDETKIIKRVLEKATKKKTRLVVDFGAHIGWYTIMAAQMGYDVIAFEGQPDHILLLENNIKIAGVENKVFVETTWVDEKIPPARLNTDGGDYYKEVYFVKIDLEGNEQYAIQCLENLLKEKKIHYIFMEVSPVFNDTYPALVKKIMKYGYSATMDGKPFDPNKKANWNFDQGDLLFERQA